MASSDSTACLPWRAPETTLRPSAPASQARSAPPRARPGCAAGARSPVRPPQGASCCWTPPIQGLQSRIALQLQHPADANLPSDPRPTTWFAPILRLQLAWQLLTPAVGLARHDSTAYMETTQTWKTSSPIQVLLNILQESGSGCPGASHAASKPKSSCAWAQTPLMPAAAQPMPRSATHDKA